MSQAAGSPSQPRVPVRQGLFVDAEDPWLFGGVCRSCDARHFPRQEVCPYCSADSVEDARICGPGRLWAYTAVTAAPPGYRGDIPYGFGVVELSEGLRVIGRLTESDPSRLELGQSMALAVVPLHVDEEGRQVVTYAFTPVPPGTPIEAEDPAVSP